MLFKFWSLFVVKIGTIIKIDNSFHLYFLFSVVSMTIKIPVLPQNVHFNLKLYILTSMSLNFWSNKLLKLPLFYVQNCASFSLIIPWCIFVVLNSSWRSKIALQPICWHFHWIKKFWECQTLLCYHSSPLSNPSITQYLFRTQKFGCIGFFEWKMEWVHQNSFFLYNMYKLFV